MENENLENSEAVIINNEDYGDIKINHGVVANIVKLAALNVVGVHAVGSSLYDGIAGFLKQKGDSGVKVSEDEAGLYLIEVRVTMEFGVELAKVAAQLQKVVSEKVLQMTDTQVSRINVFIDEVKLSDSDAEDALADDWNAPQTD